MVEGDYAKGGYMALLCGGVDQCPYTFEPWDWTAAMEDSAARHGTETGVETKAREAREARALAQAHQEIAQANQEAGRGRQ